MHSDPQLKTLKLKRTTNGKCQYLREIDQLLERLAAGTRHSKSHRLTRISQKDIVGRETELQTLRQRLLNDHETVLVNGMGGIGKTTLAACMATFYDAYSIPPG
ncbi:MAG: hypothetical protein R3C26_01905 [Calditrichia bacterium]